MNRAPKLIVAAAAVLALATGCGGSDGRPSVDEIADSLTSNSDLLGGTEITDEQATCFAEAFHDSDLSDDALNALVDGDEDYEGSDEDNEALSGVTSSAMDCATS